MQGVGLDYIMPAVEQAIGQVSNKFILQQFGYELTSRLKGDCDSYYSTLLVQLQVPE